MIKLLFFLAVIVLLIGFVTETEQTTQTVKQGIEFGKSMFDLSKDVYHDVEEELNITNESDEE